MKAILIIVLIFSTTIFCSSCEKPGEEENFIDFKEILYQRFNGKYEVISSVSSVAVDINMDGIASSNLQEELSDLKYTNLEIRIIKGENYNLFHQFWPEQYLNVGFPEDKPTINYARQGLVLKFDFSDKLDEVILNTSEVSQDESERFVVPTSVKIVEDDLVKITFTKKVYTNSGWKSITITTSYKRWTTVT